MNLYTTTALLGVIAALDTPSSFLLDLYFPQMREFETEEIYLDKLSRARKLAPFVSPQVEGKIQRQRGYTTTTFTPAYVKPKHVVEPGQALRRSAGERIGGDLSAEERFELAVAQTLKDQDEQITRREEWMASQILRTGKVLVEGEDYGSQEVDFGRAAGLTKALTGGNRWGETGVSILGNLRTWAGEVSSASGANPREVVLDPLAANLLQADPELQKILDNRRQVSGAIELAPMVTGAQGEEFVMLGDIGQFRFWQYQQVYTNAAGQDQKMLPDYTVILGSPALAEGVRAYGAIQDKKAGLQPLARFPKMWDVDDPSSTVAMTQSAPLPVLGRPDATMCATVR